MAGLSAIIVVFGRKNPSTPQWKTIAHAALDYLILIVQYECLLSD